MGHVHPDRSKQEVLCILDISYLYTYNVHIYIYISAYICIHTCIATKKNDGKVGRLEMMEESSCITWWKHFSLWGDPYRHYIHVFICTVLYIYDMAES